MQRITTYFSVRRKKACQSGFLFHSFSFTSFFFPHSLFLSAFIPVLCFTPLFVLLACLRKRCQGAARTWALASGGCSAAAVTHNIFLPRDLLQPGLWCAACTVCQHTCRDCSRLQINDWLWPGRISLSSSSPSYVKVGMSVSGSKDLEVRVKIILLWCSW